MGTTLQNGVYLPNEGERNCYAGLKTNWEILDQKVADVTALQQAVAGALHRQIVTQLPTEDIDPNTIYMILSGTSATENVYNEFMYVNNAWELIGTSATDLTNYYTKSEVDGKLLLKASASDLTSHTGDTTIHVTTADKNKWNNQTYVFRYSSTALVASSTNSNALLDNTDNLKVGDKVIDSSGVLFSVTAIDTANSTFTIGTALIDLAQDSDVVHKSGDETVGGKKELSEITTFAGSYLGNEGSNSARTCMYSYCNRDTKDYSGIYQRRVRQNRAQGSMSGSDISQYAFDVLENQVRTNNVLYFVGRDFTNDIPKTMYIASQCDTRGLGSSLYPWSNTITNQINGLNPSALSLPDLSNGIDISSYLTTGNSNNTYTPPANGWISISIGASSGGLAIFLEQGDMKASSYSVTGKYQDTSISCFACLPVVAGVEVNIGLKGSGNYVNSAKFFPCQGNV